MTPPLTLVIAVYNNARALEFIFRALARQTMYGFEVIVADDGSGRAVADVVNAAKRRREFPIRHLWHGDKGWRKNVMLNDAVRASVSEYLVFIDGDCIPSSHFLQDHYEHREIGRVLLGRRVEHGRRWAEGLTGERIDSGDYERYHLADVMDGLSGASARLEHGIRITNPSLRSLIDTRAGMLGSNFSIHKEHLLAVNGFDELYDGPGFGEDTDLFHRLQLIGVTGKSLRNLAVHDHLWHPQTRVPERNRHRFEETVRRGEARCVHGLAR